MKGELRCRVDRPPADVFDFLADLRWESEWNPRVIAVEKATPGPIGAGTRFHGTYRGIGALDTELLLCERPSRIVFRSSGPRMDIDGTFVLTPAGSGTDIALDADFRPSGLLGLIAPLMGPVFRRQNAAAAERLKTALERPATR